MGDHENDAAVHGPDLGGAAVTPAAGQDAVGVVMELEAEADLLEVVGAGHAVGGLAHVLDRRQ